MKRITGILLVFVLLCSLTAGAAETMLGREEIPLAETEAAGLQRLGMLLGTEKGLELEREVTRAEAVVMISRTAGLIFDDIGYLTPAFSDIDGHWAEDMIEKFYHAGYINGVSETRFEPDRTVTGKEFAKILLTVLGYEITDLKQAYEKGRESDLLNNNFTKSVVYHDMTLLRSDAVRLCRSALTTLDASGKMLYKKLIENGMYQQSDFEGFLFGGTPAAKKTTFADEINNTLMPQDQNYMFSPLSIRMALALAANGAEGETKSEILGAMKAEDLDAFNEQAKKLIETYSKTDVVKLNVANSIWINRSRCEMQFSEAYRKSIADFYRGDAFEVTDANAVKEINSWVSEKTNGKIPTLINDPDFWAYLANAVYFKGQWQMPFNPNTTKKETFTDRHGEKAEMDFMHKTAYFNYFENDGLQMIELPYSNREVKLDENGEYAGSEYHEELSVSMFLLIPKEGRVTDAEALLKSETLQSAYVHFSMPKFKTEFSTPLNDIFHALGIKRAFSRQAEFGRMFEEGNMWITDSIHKTYINVDENGTEAAAATGIGGAGSALPPQPIECRADRPFTYIIRDNLSGEILFMGEYAFAD